MSTSTRVKEAEKERERGWSERERRRKNKNSFLSFQFVFFYLAARIESADVDSLSRSFCFVVVVVVLSELILTIKLIFIPFINISFGTMRSRRHAITISEEKKSSEYAGLWHHLTTFSHRDGDMNFTAITCESLVR